MPQPWSKRLLPPTEAGRTATEASRESLATKADLAQLEGRLEAKFAGLKADFAKLEGRREAKFAAAINKMLLGQLAVAGVLFAALKLF